MDAETRQLLRGTIRQVLEKASALDLQDHLSELGWAEVVADDPQTALEVLFDAQGRSLAATPALDDVVLTALAPVVGEASGATAVIYPSPPQGSRPSSTALPAATPDVHVEGLALAGLERATRLVVPVITTDSIGLALLERGAWVDSVPIQGIDATAGFSWVEGQSSVPASQLYVGDEVTEAWTTAVAAARRAQGYELVAMADEMLTLAVSHVVDRFQFGRAIGSYQAVKHRLAEVLVSITAARSALNESWADGDPALLPWRAVWRGGRTPNRRNKVSRSWAASASPGSIPSITSSAVVTRSMPCSARGLPCGQRSAKKSCPVDMCHEFRCCEVRPYIIS